MFPGEDERERGGGGEKEFFSFLAGQFFVHCSLPNTRKETRINFLFRALYKGTITHEVVTVKSFASNS